MNLIEKIKWHVKRKILGILYKIRFLIIPEKTIKGIKIPVDYNWSFSLLEQIYKGDYEGGEINILINTLKKEDRVLEIGTGLGLISSYCSKKVGNNNVYTYEANPNLKPIIEKTYTLNNISPNNSIALVSLEDKKTKFYIEPNDVWSSSLIKNSETSIPVELDSLNINKIIEKIDPNYLIMDIEGYEYELIPFINWKNINKIQIEIHTKFFGVEKTNEIIHILSKHGFQIDQTLTKEEQFYFSKN